MSAPSSSLRNPAHLHDRLPAWRARLEEERRFLLAQSFIMAAEREALPTRCDDPATVALVAATDTALVDVDSALARMESGDYGSCLVCGRAIPAARLDVLPMTPRCRPCQRGLTRPQRTVLSSSHGAGRHPIGDSRGRQRRPGRARHADGRNQC